MSMGELVTRYKLISRRIPEGIGALIGNVCMAYIAIEAALMEIKHRFA